MVSVPVIALTGHLGVGKTTLLNHILQTPGARIGAIVNDFGDVNVDAALVSGQIDEPASIAGGCIRCLPDDGELDAALAKLADPKLRLDAIVIEASGVADPAAIARIIGFSEIAGVRDGGVVDVVDAARHFDTVDRGGPAPARYGAATLVVVNKLSETIRSRAAEPIQESGRTIHATLSIGATLAVPGETVSSVIARADAAMYQAKSGDRNTVVLVEPSQPSTSTTW
jgi:G3E family GTPase